MPSCCADNSPASKAVKASVLEGSQDSDRIDGTDITVRARERDESKSKNE